jgi:uncharacterized membrane protein YcgQ (UPF0703/DUF1980 family)
MQSNINKYIIIKNYKWLGLKLTYFLDIILLVLAISFLINDVHSIILSLIDKTYEIFNFNDVMSFMTTNVNNDVSNVPPNTINTQIIHDDGSWSNAIRSLFIYGSGGYRL